MFVERERERERESSTLYRFRCTRGAATMKVHWVGRQEKVMSMCLVAWRSSAKSRWCRCLEETATQLHWPPMEISTAGEYLEYVQILMIVSNHNLSHYFF